jgi:DNA-binding NarL/FixJ family response regulator
MTELSEKARKLYNEQMKSWKKRNPDKVRQYKVNYWEKKAREYSIEMQIRDLRAKGLSQRQIAERLNISVGSVNNYLNKD